MTESLSIQQARKLVLLSQRLPPARQTGRAIEATLSAIEHLGYIQIDTISAVQRAHYRKIGPFHGRRQGLFHPVGAGNDRGVVVAHKPSGCPPTNRVAVLAGHRSLW